MKHRIVNVYRKVQSWDAATILTALSTFYTWRILADARVQAEIQHYNTAWLLVNSSSKNLSSSADSAPNNGGRKEALEFLKDEGRSLQGAYLSQSILSYIDLNGMDLNRVNMENADLFGGDLTAASMWSAQMKDANLHFAKLQGADLTRAHLECADLRGAHLEELNVDECLDRRVLHRPPAFPSDAWVTWWIEARWRHEDFHRPLTEPLKKQLWHNVHNEYVTENIIKSADRYDSTPLVIGTNLKHADLSCAHLEGADLEQANLMNAHLENYIDTFEPGEDAKPYCTRLSGVLLGLDWRKPFDPGLRAICNWVSKHPDSKDHIELPTSFFCQTPRASISTASSANTNLTRANLTGANLTNTNLRGAILRDATMEKIQIRDAYLCDTILPVPDANMLRDRDCFKSPALASRHNKCGRKNG